METIAEILNSLENIKHRTELIKDSCKTLNKLYPGQQFVADIKADNKVIEVATKNIIKMLVK